MAVRRIQVTTQPAVGSNGSAVALGVTKIPITGFVTAIHFKRDVGPVSSTDAIIREKFNNPSKTILTVTNLSADGWYYPRATLVDPSGTALVGPVDYIDVTDYLELRIEGANPGSVVTATIEWDDGRPPVH